MVRAVLADFLSVPGGLGPSFEGEAAAEAVDLALESCVESLYKVDQYLQVDREAQERIADSYRSFLADLDKAGAAAAIVAHRRRLASIVASLGGGEGRREGGRLMAKPCFFYEPLTQLSVLGLEDGAILEPILDLGCGPRASLVSFLRGRGLEAYGVDRIIEGEAAWLLRASWEEVELGAGRWGTVISHLAFSNHAIHHYLRRDGVDLAYARRYMSILSSLLPGGSFCYAPSLPFLEVHLDRGAWGVASSPVTSSPLVTAGLRSTRVTKLER